MTLPNVPLDSQTEKKHRELLARAINELIKVRPPHDRTAEEVAGNVTPIDYTIRPPIAMPKRYGAKGDGVTNDNNAFTTLELAYTGQMIDLGGLEYAVSTTLPNGNNYYNGTFVITSDDAPRNAAFGWQALANNTFVPFAHPSSTLDFASGNYNSAFGSFALNANTTGRRNTAVGAEALQVCTTGFYNTCVGALSGTGVTSGSNNVFVGVQAGQFTTDGTDNVAVGDAALNANTSGDFNVAIGRQALRDATTANGNTAVGRRASLVLTTGTDNVAVGEDSFSGNLTGNDNTIVGDSAAGAAANFSNVVAFGSRAASANTANNTTAIGTDALISNTSGTKNTAVGYSALASNTTGVNNTAVGDIALGLCTGDNNAGFGTEALTSLTTGDRNTAIGYSSLSSVTTADNCSGLGYNSQVTGGNQVQLGDSNTTTYAYGAVQNRSDVRDKADVRDTQLGLEFILKLRPVDYRWDYREDYGWGTKDGSKKRTRFHQGLIAQEVKTAMDELGVDFGGFQDHSKNGGKDVLSLGYAELVPVLIKAVQELSARVAQLEAA